MRKLSQYLKVEATEDQLNILAQFTSFNNMKSYVKMQISMKTALLNNNI